MSEPSNLATAPRVGAYALIGQDDCLLLVKHADHDVLPGGAVHAGEPVEQALRRTLHSQLGVTIADLDFCAVVEHSTTKPGEPLAFEVAVLFDVTLTDRDLLTTSTARPHRWADERHLSALRPATVRDKLIAGTLTINNPWTAWTP